MRRIQFDPEKCTGCAACQMACNDQRDILCALKDDHMYNLKLSEHLGLSPSTVSHHMNVLLGSGFITVEKKEGKVYYCLHREHISQFISALEHMLIS